MPSAELDPLRECTYPGVERPDAEAGESGINGERGDDGE